MHTFHESAEASAEPHITNAPEQEPATAAELQEQFHMEADNLFAEIPLS